MDVEYEVSWSSAWSSGLILEYNCIYIYTHIYIYIIDIVYIYIIDIVYIYIYTYKYT